MKIINVNLLVAASILVSGSAYSGTSLNYSAVVPEGAESKSGFRLVVSDDTVAVVSTDKPDRPQLLYRSATKEVVFVDQTHREYTVLTEQWLREANEKAEKSAEEMRERLEKKSKDLSPAMRKQYERANTMMNFMPLMGGMLGGSSSKTDARYTNKSRSSEFNGMKCSQYDEFIDGERTRVLCLGQVSSIGISADAGALVEDYFKTLARMQNEGVFDYGFHKPQFMMFAERPPVGIPVAVSHPDGSGYVLETPADVENDPQIFELPSSYLQTQIPMMGF